MTVIPSTIQAKVQQIGQWSDQWSAAAASIGITPAQAAAFATQAAALESAYVTQRDAKTASKNATIALHSQLDRTVTMTGELINVIKAYAETQPNPSAVYINALVPPPKTPTPVPAPGAPLSLKATVDTVDGSVTLTWKPNNPPNSNKVVYQVWRKLPTQTSFAYLQTVGVKSFNDESVPAGVATIMYQIVPVCGQQVGERSETLVVQLGVSSSGSGAAPMILSQFTQSSGGAGEMNQAA